MHVGKKMVFVDRRYSSVKVSTVTIKKVGRKYLTLSTGDRAEIDSFTVVANGLRYGRLYYSMAQYREDEWAGALWKKIVHQIAHMERPAALEVFSLARKFGVTDDDPTAARRKKKADAATRT